MVRDLGFVGEIDPTMLFTFDDTMSIGSPFYMVSESSSVGNSDPCYVLNPQYASDGAHTTSMIAPNAASGESSTDDAFGGIMLFSRTTQPQPTETIRSKGLE